MRESKHLCRKAHLLEDKQIPSVGVFDEHLESIWRKYIHFGLNLGRNETRLQLYSKTLKNSFADRGDGVKVPCDTVRTFKGRRQDHPDDVKVTDSRESRRRFTG
ncbi:hypothetical protein Tco_1066989 [Tanacetum coccineum]|uniref:Uncharacterized protein n=1 Tax=Tanacetum coccineum TaxID=301880 RepID=A0ABQ5HDB1_9ASTR